MSISLVWLWQKIFHIIVMDVSKEEIYILYKYDPYSGENRVKGLYKSLIKAQEFKRYLEKRNRIKLTKGEEVSQYSIERARVYVDLVT